MNYSDALNKIHSFQPFGMKLGLSRLQKLLEMMGNPQDKLKFVHVAGTNGKGSVCAFISSVMKECGYKTGLYTSPAIIDFRERIQINGKMIEKEDIAGITKKVADILESIKDEGFFITEFEFITAIAFEYFMEEECDIVVLETGLGGRFDATNVIKSPLASVITSISFDHTRILGDTLSKIAIEKCGIIKQGCDVVVYPDQDNSVINIIKGQAAEKKSEIFIASGSDVKKQESSKLYETLFIYDNEEYKMRLLGRHQLNNVSTAMLALKVISKNFNICKEGLYRGIKNAKIPARLEVLSKKPLIILDGAHNASGIEALKNFLVEDLSDKNLVGITGMLADKDVETSFSFVLPLFKRITIVKPSINRALGINEAKIIARRYNKNVLCETSLENALKTEISKLKKEDALIIFGSLYLCSDVKETLKSGLTFYKNIVK